MKKRILFVDDEADCFSQSVRETMPEYECRFERNPLHTMAMALKFLPDVFCLDLKMQGLGGLELAEVIRSHGVFRKTPIIFISQTVPRSTDSLPAMIAGEPAFGKPIDFQAFRHFLQVRLALVDTAPVAPRPKQDFPKEV